MATLEALQERQNTLIRKALSGSAFIAPFSATAPTTATLFTSSANTLASSLPTGFADLGWLTSDGVSITDKYTEADVDSWGSAEPNRTDITKRDLTLKVVCQETNINTLSLYTGVDPSVLIPVHTTDILHVVEPSLPGQVYFRVLVMSKDTGTGGDIYMIRHFPRVKVTDKDDEVYSDANEKQYGVTLTAYNDDVLGYSSERWFGGPGWAALVTSAGFTPASS